MKLTTEERRMADSERGGGHPGGRVVTNSAKFAHYAPTGMRVETLFRSTAECVEAAVSGIVDG